MIDLAGHIAATILRRMYSVCIRSKFPFSAKHKAPWPRAYPAS